MSSQMLHSLRALGRNRLASAVVVVTLGLGIGATCSIFGVLEAAVLRPLPFPEPDRLVAVWSAHLQQGVEKGLVSMADFLDWREASRGFEALAVIQDSGMALAGEGEPEEIVTSLVSTDFFRVLGIQPALGRSFLPEEGIPGRDRVIVLADGLWRRRFGADPDVVGRTLLLDGQEHVVVAVMPSGFWFPSPDVELWTPLALDPRKRDRLLRNRRIMRVVARLDDGVDLQRVDDEMTAIAARLAERYPATNSGWGIRLVPLHEELAGDVRLVLLLLLLASAVVLLMTAANVATLLVARGTARRQELAVRVSLGARTPMLAWVLSAEVLWLVLAGLGLGLLIAHAVLRVLVATRLDIPRLAEARVDLRVLLFALVVAAGVFALAAVPAALRAGRAVTASSLPGDRVLWRPASGARRVTGPLLAVEVALALALLTGAGLVVRSLLRISAEDPGFRSERLLTARLRLPAARYGQPVEIVDFHRRLLDSVASHPDVQAAAITSALPMSPVGVELDLPFKLEDGPRDSANDEEQAQIRVVSPQYFRALGIPLLQGRGLTDRDRQSAPLVALVNSTFARRAWPAGEAVGRRISLPLRGWRSHEVVGIVGDVRHRGLGREPQPEIYLPFDQAPLRNMTLVVRAATEPMSLATVLKARVRAIDEQQPIAAMVTMDEVLRATASSRQLATVLVLHFAGLSWFLAAIGIFGVTAFVTGQRMREFGIHKALGASPAALLRLAVSPVLIWVATGVALGLPAAFAGGQLLSGFLYGVSPLDPLALAAAVAMLAVALAGSLLPARRALRVDPAVALRCE